MTKYKLFILIALVLGFSNGARAESSDVISGFSTSAVRFQGAQNVAYISSTDGTTKLPVGSSCLKVAAGNSDESLRQESQCKIGVSQGHLTSIVVTYRDNAAKYTPMSIKTNTGSFSADLKTWTAAQGTAVQEVTLTVKASSKDHSYFATVTVYYEGTETGGSTGGDTGDTGGTGDQGGSGSGGDTGGTGGSTTTQNTYRSDGTNTLDPLAPLGYGASVTGGGEFTAGSLTLHPKKTIIATTREQLIAALNGTEEATIFVKGTLYFNGADTIRNCQNKSVYGLKGSLLINNVERSTLGEGNATNTSTTYKDENGNTQTQVKYDRMVVDRTGILCFKDCQNIALRNLKFQGQGVYDIDGKDCLTLHGSQRIWVDHCYISDGLDGNFDCIHGSDNISVTWTKLHYEKLTYERGATGDGKDHRECYLWGHNDQNAAEDEGKLNTTFYACLWGYRCKARMPRVRFGKVHIVNCLYDTQDAEANGIGIGLKANVLAKNCYMKSGKSFYIINSASTLQYYRLHFEDCIIATNKNTPITPDLTTYKSKTLKPSANALEALTLPYTLEAFDTERVPQVVDDENAGAGQTLTIAEPTETTSAIEISPKKEFTTLCSPYDLDFTTLSNNSNGSVKAYVISAYDLNSRTLTATEAQQTAAGEGLLLRSSAQVVQRMSSQGGSQNTVSVPLATSDVSLLKTNYMKGALVPLAIGKNADFEDESHAFHYKDGDDFVLQNGAFHRSSFGYIAAGKAYLQLPTGSWEAAWSKDSDTQQQSAPLTVVFEDMETTGISDINKPNNELNPNIYDLQGRKVSHPQKGVYIVNGRKVVF